MSETLEREENERHGAVLDAVGMLVDSGIG